MTVGICGLGLIGGSMAKAYKQEGHTVLGYDRDQSTFGFATLAGVIDGELNQNTIKNCELVFVALYPEATIEYLKSIAEFVDKNTVVMDLCGTKKLVCEAGMELAEKYGFTFVGGHPMAGTQYSGIKYSKATLFKNAPMVIVPPVFDDISFLDKIKTMLKPAGFSKFSVTSAEEHDSMIAFTSQLAHVVSNAYVKSPTAANHKGFSAGSYKDLTRVAWLNENMWTELFLENRDFLVEEIDLLIENLSKYSKALKENSEAELRQLLKDGKDTKKQAG